MILDDIDLGNITKTVGHGLLSLISDKGASILGNVASYGMDTISKWLNKEPEQ